MKIKCLQCNWVGRIESEVNECPNCGRAFSDRNWRTAQLLRKVAAKKPYDVVNGIINFEDGNLDAEEELELFQELVNNGMAWSLQGSYGRHAHALIEAGLIQRRKD